MFGAKYYAHRGLHSEKIIENTMESFELAKEKGFGIELDVHLTLDNKIVVFHDYTLERLVGDDRYISTIPSNELKNYKLKRTGQGIVLLDEVLDLVKSEVPIVVEIKSLFREEEMANRVVEASRAYKGNIAFKSFNHDLMDKLKIYAPEVLCGKVFSKLISDTPMAQQMSLITDKSYFSYDKMDFISVSYNELMSKYIAVAKRKGVKVMSWTLKDKTLANLALKKADAVMFEGFIPKK